MVNPGSAFAQLPLGAAWVAEVDLLARDCPASTANKSSSLGAPFSITPTLVSSLTRGSIDLFSIAISAKNGLLLPCGGNESWDRRLKRCDACSSDRRREMGLVNTIVNHLISQFEVEFMLTNVSGLVDIVLLQGAPQLPSVDGANPGDRQIRRPARTAANGSAQ